MRSLFLALTGFALLVSGRTEEPPTPPPPLRCHRQDTTNLMQSGTTGFSLNDAEIATAREVAQKRLTKGAEPQKPPEAAEPN